jgi:hypothetical protein
MHRIEEEVVPRDFVADLPPRRLGLWIVRIIAVLIAGLYSVSLFYTGVDDYRFDTQLERRINAMTAPVSAVPAALPTDLGLEKHIMEHAAAKRRLWDLNEKVALALIALLSVVIGHSLQKDR